MIAAPYANMIHNTWIYLQFAESLSSNLTDRYHCLSGESAAAQLWHCWHGTALHYAVLTGRSHFSALDL